MGNTVPKQALGLIAIFCLMLGCQRPALQLEYVTIGIDELKSPPIFGVTLKNSSSAGVTVTKCIPKVLSAHIFTVGEEAAALPAKFEFHAELWQTQQGLTIAPGNESTIPVLFVWDLPTESTGLVAACRASFTMNYGTSHAAQTEEVMFLVGSTAEARDRLLSSPLDDVANAAEILQGIDSFEGRKSEGVQQVAKKLRESLGV